MINVPPATLLRAEIQRLHAQYPAHYVFALLDPHRPLDVEHPLHLSSLRQQEPKLDIQTVLRPDLDYLPEICPHLLTLAQPNDAPPVPDDLLEQLVEQASIEWDSSDGVYVCGVLVSSAPARATAQHLAQALVIRPSEDAEHCVVALFEPPRLEALVRSVPQTWLDAWLGPIAAWRYVNAAGQIGQINRASEMPTVATPILPPGAYAAQQRIPLLNRLLNAWRDIDGLPPDAARRADEALQQAAQHGLVASGDQLFFALNGLLLPERWAQHPATRACIQQAVAAESSLPDAFAKLDAQTQAEIVRI